RVVAGDLGTDLRELLEDGECRRLSNVVGFRLERETPDRDALARKVAAEVREHFLTEQALLLLVRALDGVDDRERHVVLAPGVSECPQVLREARAAEAGAC